jgi:hypothetical protein
VRVIRVDTEDRKIGLSFVHADFEENDRLVAQYEKERAEREAASAVPEAGDAPSAEAPEPRG